MSSPSVRPVTQEGITRYLRHLISRRSRTAHHLVENVSCFRSFDLRTEYVIDVWDAFPAGCLVRVDTRPFSNTQRLKVNFDLRRWNIAVEAFVPGDASSGGDDLANYVAEFQESVSTGSGHLSFFERRIPTDFSDRDVLKIFNVVQTLQRLTQCGCGRPAVAESDGVSHGEDPLCPECQLTIPGSQYAEVGGTCLICLDRIRRGHLVVAPCCGVTMHRSCKGNVCSPKCPHCRFV